ncbi:MAG: tRNA(adenine34) deaminase [Gammaproteobacteria bacterium]
MSTQAIRVADAMTAADADLRWMRQALALAQRAACAGEVPVGAVLVRDGQLLAEGYNRPIGDCDPSAHAEIVTLRAGAAAMANYRLIGTTLYVTMEPCAMCAGAIVHARVARVVYGAADQKWGACGSVFNLFEPGRLNHDVDLVGGVLGADSVQLLQAFFRARRSQAIAARRADMVASDD